MRIKYTGPFDAVEVPALGLIVDRGKSLEVDDEIGESLCSQDSWEEIASRKTKESD